MFTINSDTASTIQTCAILLNASFGIMQRVVTVEQLAFRTLAEVLSQPEGQRLKQEDFAFVTADSTLQIASALFHDHKIKFLPVVVPGENSVLAIISHLEILEFLVNTFREKRQGFFQSSVMELRIGVFEKIITVQQVY